MQGIFIYPLILFTYTWAVLVMASVICLRASASC